MLSSTKMRNTPTILEKLISNSKAWSISSPKPPSRWLARYVVYFRRTNVCINMGILFLNRAICQISFLSFNMEMSNISKILKEETARSQIFNRVKFLGMRIFLHLPIGLLQRSQYQAQTRPMMFRSMFCNKRRQWKNLSFPFFKKLWKTAWKKFFFFNKI